MARAPGEGTGLVRVISKLASKVAGRLNGYTQHGVERAFEIRFGVHTSDAVALEDLGLAAADRLWYDPSNWMALRRALGRLRVGPGDVFLDYGAGMGRALLVAGGLPFRRIVGVELSDRLATAARENIDRCLPRMKTADFEVVVADALDYDVPDDVTVAYFHCPFLGDTFEGVIDRLLASVDRSPRVVRLVYNYPVEHSRLIGTGHAEVLDVAPRSWPPRRGSPDDVIVTYLLLPSGGRRAVPGPLPTRGRGLKRAPQWLGPYDPGFRNLTRPPLRGGAPGGPP
jgi:SAM-dependent methyltransferase